MAGHSTVEVVINNAWIKHRAGSVRVSRAVGQRGTAEFDVMDSEAMPQEGDEAGVFDHGVGIFNGTIHEIKRIPAAAKPGSPAWYRCLCTDWEHRLDRQRVAAAAFYGKSAGQIVREILETYAAGEVHIGQIEEGASAAELGTIVYRGRMVSEIITDLAERSNFIWHVDNVLMFYFVPRTYENASLEITAAARNYREPEILSTRADYFNRIHLAISHEAVAPRTFSIAGDQSWPEFRLTDENGFPLALDIIVRASMNGVEQSVGVDVEDATATLLFVQGQPILRWNPATVSPSSADVITVEFYALGDNVVTLQDDAEIEARRSVEYDNGIYAAYLEDLDCKDLTDAQSRCAAFLTQHAPARANPALAAGTMPREYKWVTFSHELRIGAQSDPNPVKYVTDLWPGRVIRFNPSTPTSEDVQVVIQSVEATEIKGAAPAGQRVGAGILRYDIRAIDCSKLAGYFDFYRALAEVGGGSMPVGRSAADLAVGTGESITLSMGLTGDLSEQDGFTEKTLSIPIGKVMQLVRAEANVEEVADADIKLDAEYSTDGGSTWTSIFLVASPPSYPTIPAGYRQMTAPFGQFHSFPGPSTLAARCLVRPSIKACGSASPGSGLHFDLIGELRAA